MIKQMKKLGAAALAVPATAVLVASPVYAEGWNYSGITTGVDFSSIGTGVLAVAALLAAVYAGIKGARIVLGFLRS